MPEMPLPRRIEITYEEPFWAEETSHYLLKMKKVREFAVTARKGWMGAVYHRPVNPIDKPDFVANTKMKDQRPDALASGIVLMNRLQAEVDEAVAKAK